MMFFASCITSAYEAFQNASVSWLATSNHWNCE